MGSSGGSKSVKIDKQGTLEEYAQYAHELGQDLQRRDQDSGVKYNPLMQIMEQLRQSPTAMNAIQNALGVQPPQAPMVAPTDLQRIYQGLPTEPAISQPYANYGYGGAKQFFDPYQIFPKKAPSDGSGQVPFTTAIAAGLRAGIKPQDAALYNSFKPSGETGIGRYGDNIQYGTMMTGAYGYFDPATGRFVHYDFNSGGGDEADDGDDDGDDGGDGSGAEG